MEQSIHTVDQQLASPWFKLPPEIRELLYRHIFLDGATTQHLSTIYGTAGSVWTTRNPCVPMKDEDFLRDSYAQHGSDVLASKNMKVLAGDRLRNGHMKCGLLMEQKVPQGRKLQGPTKLLLTCRKIYDEAVSVLYSFHFKYQYHLLDFLEYSRSGTLDRIRTVEFIWQDVDKDTGKLFQSICGRLANLRSLQQLKIVFDSSLRKEALMLSARQLEMLSWIKQPLRFEVQLRNVPVDETGMVEGPTPQMPFILRRVREQPWVYGHEELSERGLDCLEVINEKYALPVRGNN
jgi:hypothetical protein